MAKLLAAPTKNAIQKTLASQLLSSAGATDPITFDDVDGIANLPGNLVINRVDSSGVATPAKREYIEYSGTSGNTVLITTRNVDGSNSALTHAVGSIVEFIPDVTWADRIYDSLATVVDVDDISVTKAVLLTGNQTIAGVKTFSSFPVTPSSDPTTDYQVATKKYVDDNAGAGGKYQFIIPGNGVVGTDVAGTWFPAEAGTITGISLYADTAGATGASTFDVNLNGTTIYTTQGDRPSLADTATEDENTVPAVTSFAEGDKFTVDQDESTTTPGQDFYIVIKYS
jgi:hypothetical protein